MTKRRSVRGRAANDQPRPAGVGDLTVDAVLSAKTNMFFSPRPAVAVCGGDKMSSISNIYRMLLILIEMDGAE
jgi:hypothetical protein